MDSTRKRCQEVPSSVIKHLHHVIPLTPSSQTGTRGPLLDTVCYYSHVSSLLVELPFDAVQTKFLSHLQRLQQLQIINITNAQLAAGAPDPTPTSAIGAALPPHLQQPQSWSSGKYSSDLKAARGAFKVGDTPTSVCFLEKHNLLAFTTINSSSRIVSARMSSIQTGMSLVWKMNWVCLKDKTTRHIKMKFDFW